MNLRWTLAAPPPARVEQVTAGLGISPLLARCLLARMPEAGEAIAPLQQFLAPRLRDLADPFLLPDMHAAVDRLRHARAHKERAVIFGDYDVDGITATAILFETLRGLGWEVEHYLPHRLEDGYGLTAETAGKCLAQYPARLLVAVDCGSSSAAAVEGLQGQGVDVIVLDHHQVGSPAPQPRAFVNPRRGGSGHELCSAGLAFKLAHALVKEGRARGEPDCLACDLRPLLELVALGTIADIVPLCGENRPMVRAGILHLQATKRPGLQALLRVAQCGRKPGGYEIAFQLAPRLNAAGRLEDAMLALALLLARDAQQADPLALRLDEQNRERQRLERVILEQVLARLHNRFHAESDYVIIEGDGLWHIGVVGIVAARVMREFYRPTIILGGNEATWRGSGRSIPGFDLASALRDCGELLERSGGHALAAGLTMDPQQIEPLRRRLNECARAALQGDQLRPELRIDAPVGLEELTTESVTELEALEPVGCGNPEIILLAQTLRLVGAPQRVGKNEQHWKFRVTDGRAEREAIWWGAKAAEPPAGEFALAFSPELNEYGGRTRVQLRVRDWKPTALTALSPGG